MAAAGDTPGRTPARMSEPVFLRHSRGLTLDEIAALTGATLASPAPHARRIVNIAPLDRAAPFDLTFFDNKRYAAAAATTHAAACITTAALAKDLPARVAVLTVREPYRAFVAAARELFPNALRPSSLSGPGDFTRAHVDPSARMEDGVTIEPGAVIGPRAEIGGGTVIGANAVIGTEVRIGRECSIGAGASISNALIGDRVIVHPGCKIGQDRIRVRDGRKRSRKSPAGRTRYYSRRRRNRSWHQHRPRSHSRYSDRRGHEDRQPGSGRPQCRHWPALHIGCANGHFRQFDIGRTLLCWARVSV